MKIFFFFITTVFFIQQNTSAQQSVQIISGQYADPDIIRDSLNGVWRLYFGVEPQSPGNQLEIFTATSTDGMNWALSPDTLMKQATFPDIIKLPNGQFRLYFQRMQEIHSAITSDGINFTDEPGVRITDTMSVASPSTIILNNGNYLMIYRETFNGKYSSTSINNVTTDFRMATSTDGLIFIIGPIIADSRNSVFDGYIDGNELLYMDDGNLHLRFWTSAGTANQQQQGHYEMCSNDNGITWSSYQQVNDSIMGGDPTYAKINGKWLMYYTILTQGIYSLDSVSVSNLCANAGISGKGSEENIFFIYPNPFSTYLRITNLSESTNQELRIFDAMGKIVFHSKINNPQSEIHLDLQNGIYFLQIKNADFIQTQKLEVIK